MGNKVFLKVSIVVLLSISIYIFFITFILSPKVTKYLTDSETRSANAQLQRVASIIKSEEEILRKHKYQRIVENKKNIKDISNIAYSMMDSSYKLYLDGKLTKEEAIKRALFDISKITYGYKDDYIYVVNKKGDLIYHPDERYANQNIYYSPDAKGRLVIEQMIKNSIKYGSTYTKYYWTKLDSDFISEKISHSVYFKPFDLIISSGVYIQSIEEELQKEKEEILKILDPMIMSTKIGDKGYIFIMDKNNKMILHPNKKLINFDMSKFKQPNSNTYMVDDLKDAYKNNRVWEYKWNTPEDKENFKYNKLSWVKYNEFFGWYIVSSIYEDDLKSKAKELNEITVTVSIALLLVLLLISMFLIKKFLKPIFTMSENAKLVKSGKFDVRNNIDVKDELGLLANHFDKMLDYIEENTKNLEQKVEERTKELRHKLYHDELTGLKNREALNKDINKSEFQALSSIDINDFHELNELYGLSVGDEILLKVARRLEKFAKENNLSLYRTDSDIFSILDTSLSSFSSYEKFLEKVQELFKKELHIKSLDIDIYVYVTVGTSIAQEDPIKSSNIALKKAKKMGLRYVVYNKEFDTKANIEKSMYWREKIKNAIEEDKVTPFLQPIFNRKKQIIKYEALMRIEEEVDGKISYISPVNFFDIALKTKQYFKLNQIIIEKVLKNIDKIEKDISINIAFVDILNVEFNELIEKLIKELTKEQRKKVVFEILESDFISDYKLLNEFIFKYRKKGIRIAIDDFGTGFSNFSHILEIRPDYIKIDGSLIKDIDKDPDCYEMVKSIVEFSKSLNISLIAEYIHSKDVYKVVKELKVDEFQGYFLGEPKPLEL